MRKELTQGRKSSAEWERSLEDELGEFKRITEKQAKKMGKLQEVVEENISLFNTNEQLQKQLKQNREENISLFNTMRTSVCLTPMRSFKNS